MLCSATLLRAVLVLSMCGYLGVVTSKRLASKRSRDASEVGCKHDGILHPVSSTFITSDCQMKCYCIKDGEISCVRLCAPNEAVKCENGTSPVEEKVFVGTSGSRKCYCSSRYCPKDGCYVNSKHYEVNETFTRKSCSRRCRCGEDGRLTCVPVCPKITCPKGQWPRSLGNIVRMPSGGCSCPSQKCVGPQPYCKIPADYFEHGKFFISSDCQTKCRCKKNITKHCEPLCSTSSPVCSEDEVMLATTKFYAKRRCSCIKKRCVRKGERETQHPVNSFRE